MAERLFPRNGSRLGAWISFFVLGAFLGLFSLLVHLILKARDMKLRSSDKMHTSSAMANWVACPQCALHFRVNTNGVNHVHCPQCDRQLMWYYARQQKKIGPLSRAQLQEVLLSLPDLTGVMVLLEGAQQWWPASEVLASPKQGFERKEPATVPVRTPVVPSSASQQESPRIGMPPTAPPYSHRPPSTTRRLLLHLQKSQRKMWIAASAVALAVTLLLLAILLFKRAEKQIVQPEDVFKRTLRSTCFVDNPGKGTGSGVLIDMKRRLVVTNHHVI